MAWLARFFQCGGTEAILADHDFVATQPVSEQYGILQLKDSKTAMLDVIAVPGLDGHRERSWTKGDRFWLRDLLAHDISHVRLLTYGYNAATTDAHSLSYQALDGHAKDLVESLKSFRHKSNTTRRPIIFITHSLGGIILKLALVKAYQTSPGQPDDRIDLKLSTYGVLFLGTPHRGLSDADFLVTLKQIQSSFTGVHVNSKMFQHLERDSKVLRKQLAEYTKISGQLDTKLLYEELATLIPGGQFVVLVPKSSMQISDAEVMATSLHRDHAGLSQFTRRDEDYKVVLQQIQDMVTKAVSETASNPDRLSRALDRPHNTSRSGDIGVLLLYEPSNPLECVVDIVALHGLGGHREGSWTINNVLWLRDILPRDIPTARILTYGYDAATTDARPWSPNTMKDYASDFVLRLTMYRHTTKATRRPIIFLAHSLGGIILKYALLKSNQSRVGHLEDHQDIKNSTYGILFLGTPHIGNNQDDLLLTFRRIQSALTGANINFIDTHHLEHGAEALADLLRDYAGISRDFETKCLYESYATPVNGGRDCMIVPRTSAAIPGALDVEEVAMNCDHVNLTKFSTPNNSDYTLMRDFTLKMTERCPGRIQRNWSKCDRIKAMDLED